LLLFQAEKEKSDLVILKSDLVIVFNKLKTRSLQIIQAAFSAFLSLQIVSQKYQT